ncbi:MAG: phenylacetate--CoA ligase [Oscillospiraceae bacterium]|jgi:phenylacetate-CoA ligase|nr:phenylacetate--CoA ligase [Oscillospiraceae bacterium]
MILSKEETFSLSEMEALQSERLHSSIKRVYENVPSYREKMNAAHLTPDDVKSVADISKLPFTTKDDLRVNYPYGLFAVDKSKLQRIHASSGTTGKPTVVGYTKHDLEVWTECVARIAAMGGATGDDICQIAFGYGMFTGALGLHYGLERLGAAIVPSSSGNTEKQLMYLKDFGVTLLVATPSYGLRIAEVAMQNGFNPKTDFTVRTGLFGSEPMTEAMRAELKKMWGDNFRLTQNYGMSELMGPGVSGECEHFCGMHINTDHFIPEIIDPNKGEPLPAGEHGELVITCITKEALPLIRYRTRDLTRLFTDKCACGRTTVRMDCVTGRSDDMLKIRGVNVFPGQIEEVLLGIDECGPHYELVLTRRNHTDYMEVKVELLPELLTDVFPDLEHLGLKVRTKLKTVLGIDTKVTLASPNTLQRFEGKAKRVTDLRNV